MKAIIGKKVGMSQIFDENGVLVPVTVLQAGPCVVTQVKTDENDGYTAVQVGFGDIRDEKSRLLFYYNGNSIPSIKKYGFYLGL